MARKIVRDIRPVKPNILTIEEKAASLPQAPTESSLNLSYVGQNQVVIPNGFNGRNNRIQDVRKKKSTLEANSQEQEKVFFFHIDADKRFTLDKTGEFIRLLAASILILFCINLGNIVNRGYVVKDQIVSAAYEGYNGLLEAGNKAKETQFYEAENSFNNASRAFDEALQEISFLAGNQEFGSEKTVESAQALLSAGKSISEAGIAFSKGIEKLQIVPQLFMQENGKLLQGEGALLQPPKTSLTEELKKNLQYFETAAKHVDAASEHLARVDKNVLPDHLKTSLQSIQERIQKIRHITSELQQRIPAFLKLLGDRYPQKYLVLIQNDTEARPTGGFIGSFLLLDVNDGYITKNEFRDVYQQDGLLKEHIPVPEDIARFASSWRLRDSNYAPDFAVSGEKAAWFLQKEKGPSVDTVIAINQSALAELFDLTGPISLEGLNAPLTKENYQQIISYIVESKLSGEQDPKKILRSFIPAFQKKLFEAPFEKVLTTLLQAAHQDKIMFYSRDEEIQKLFDDWGVSGRMLQTQPGEDYLQVTTVSIGGNKSDLFIDQKVLHETFVHNNGKIADRVTLTKKHTFDFDDKNALEDMLKDFGFNEISDTVRFILGEGKNKSLIKMYVPLGSELLEVKGIEKDKVATRMDSDLKKTYFMFEMEVEPGQEISVQLYYQLPQSMNFDLPETYRFFAETQPGVIQNSLEKKVFVSPSLKVHEKYPENLAKDVKDGNFTTGQILNQDMHMAVLVGR